MNDDIVILDEARLRRIVGLDSRLVGVIEDAFARLSSGGAVMPPVLSMAIAEKNAEVDVKTAYLPGLEGFAVKISPGFFDNPAKGLPSLNGMMVVLDAQTGTVRAVFLDNGYLTALRTAAAGAVAAKYFAPRRLETVAVLGAGAQARLQVEAVRLVRDFRCLRVWARNAEKAHAFAATVRARLDIETVVCAAPGDAVASAGLAISTTPSKTPLIHGDMVHRALHITAMGSDAPEKNELSPAVLAAADRYVPDSFAQCARLGELHHALEAGAVPKARRFDELGDVVTGAAAGRRHEDEMTVVDLTGVGAQDTAIADYTYRLHRGALGARAETREI